MFFNAFSRWTGFLCPFDRQVRVRSRDRCDSLKFSLFLSVLLWSSQAAFDKLDSIYGTYTEKSDVKSNFQLPRHCMTNTDLNRIINSDEVRCSPIIDSLTWLYSFALLTLLCHREFEIVHLEQFLWLSFVCRGQFFMLSRH